MEEKKMKIPRKMVPRLEVCLGQLRSRSGASVIMQRPIKEGDPTLVTISGRRGAVKDASEILRLWSTQLHPHERLMPVGPAYSCVNRKMIFWTGMPTNSESIEAQQPIRRSQSNVRRAEHSSPRYFP
jgi:hypothetical protein